MPALDAAPPRWLAWLPLWWLGLALLAFALLAPVRRLGDASDYAMATESLLYDHDLRYTPGDLARNLMRKPLGFDSPAGLHVRRGRNGAMYLGAHHSFYYSLAAVPLYAVFGYRGFFLLNAFAYWIFACCLFIHLRQWNSTAVAWAWLALALVFSASWTYVAWIHTEVLYMALLGLFVFAWQRGRLLAAAAALGVAAAAQPTLCLLAVPFFLCVWWERRRPGLLLAMAAVMSLAAAPQVAFNLYAWGAVHPMFLDAGLLSTRFMSLERVVRSWFDPVGGIVWFYPAVLVALLETRWNRRSVALWLGALAVVVACGSSVSWYSHQVGLRYGAYVFGLVLFLVEKVRFDRIATAALWSFAVLVGTGLAVDPLGNSAGLGVRNKLFLPYRVAAAKFPYPEENDAFWSRLERLSPTVGVAPIWSEGWLPGDVDVTLAVNLQQADRGPLRLVVGSWYQAGSQRLQIETATARCRADLSPYADQAVTIPLGPGDILAHSSPNGSNQVRLTLRAQSWVPRLADPRAGDVRRLGVVLKEVDFAGSPQFRRAGGALPVAAALLPQ